MLKEAQQRMSIFQRRMREQGASLALLTDENSIVYLAGFWGYLGLVGAAPLSAEFCGLPQQDGRKHNKELPEISHERAFG